MPRSTPVLLAGVGGAATAVAVVAVLALTGLVRDGDATVDGAEVPEPPAAAIDEPAAPYAVWARQSDGTPVRWDPCTPITWVLEEEGAPEGARDLVQRAMGMVERASGLRFRFVGTTDEQPARDRSLVVDGAGQDAWAPVLVSWSRPDETDLPLGDSVLGVTVPVAVLDGDRRVFTTGQVVLNADRTGSLLPGFQDRHATWGSTLVHEVAHLVGLDHVPDPTQLLAPTPGFGPIEFGAGDLAGLAEVGSGGCLPVPPATDLEVVYPAFDG